MNAPLTEEQLLELMVEQGLPSREAAELAAYLFAESEVVRRALVETYYDTLVAQFRGEVSQEILDNARALAETAATSLQNSFIESELKNIGETIAQGLKDGKHPTAIARDLKAVNNLDSVRAKQLQKFIDSDPPPSQAEIDKLREQLLKERREVIARTETAKAVSQGDAEAAKAAGAKWKIWQTTGDNRVSDECQANEAQGPIPVKQSFTSGASEPPQHPRCRCSVSYIYHEEVLAGARERAEKRAAATAAAKELTEAIDG
jgi:SPP1 gp7 family putative phage head morphogenesis protein